VAEAGSCRDSVAVVTTGFLGSDSGGTGGSAAWMMVVKASEKIWEVITDSSIRDLNL
jgi:hypothetical protein